MFNSRQAARVLITALLLFLLSSITCYAFDAPMKVVTSSEILDKIENGTPVEYEHVFINGDLNLSGLNITYESSAL